MPAGGSGRAPCRWRWTCRPTHAAFDREEGNTNRSEEHTSELQSRLHLVCRLLLEKKKPPDEPLTHHTAEFVQFLRYAISSPAHPPRFTPSTYVSTKSPSEETSRRAPTPARHQHP